jgi:hypothetical protein
VIADPALLQRWAREGDGLAMIEQRRREHLDQLKREIVEPVGNHVVAIAYHLQWFGVNVSRYGYPHGFSGGYTPGFLAGHPLANDWPRHFPQLHADLRAFEVA